MEPYDAIVVGGGISGLTFAHFSAASGKRVVILEKEPRMGGCIETHRLPTGFWHELGAHTCYNSYGGLLELVEACGLATDLLSRAKVPFRLLRDGKTVPIMRALDLLELLRSAPRIFTTRKQGRTVYAYYSRLVGRRNYGKVLGPMLSAVPCQSADAFPADMLFKRRPRRKEIPRSFTVRGGLESIVEGLGRGPGVEHISNAEVQSITRVDGEYSVRTAGGQEQRARAVVIAVPPSAAASMLWKDFPELAEQLARIKVVSVQTLGVAIAREKLEIEPVAGIVPVDDVFFSAVTRDVVPGGPTRGFAFHFKPGVSKEQRLERAAQVLGVALPDLENVAEKSVVLPSPVLGHHEVTGEIDRLIAGTRLAITGNYFAGLAIEDCVVRSKQEVARVWALK